MACERLLLADLDDELESAGDEALAQPFLVVVPSKSLRLHLLDRIVAHQRGASAGIQCLTLYAIARDIASRTAGINQGGADLLPILVRRLASQEPSLRRSLDHLHDGYASVVRPIEDLMDAGFDPALAEAIDEVLEEEGLERASNAELERSRALIRIASRCAETLSEEGDTRPSSLMRHAAEWIRAHPEAVAARSVLVYGFADATGVATDLIQALLEAKPGILYLDRPPDPAWPEETDEGIAFGRRFEERLFLVTGDSDIEPASHPQGSIQLFRSLGGQAEIRHIADQIRLLLDGGARPESIGVVARQLDPYVSVLRTQFWRMGIPFSAIGAVGPRTEFGRQVGAVLDVLKQGSSAPVERWLDASLAWSEKDSFDLKLALYGFGAARLEETADLELARDAADSSLPLPVHGTFSDHEDAEGIPNRNLERRTIPGLEVVRAREEARRICQRFDRWYKVRTLEQHADELRGFLLDDLQWPADGEEALVLNRTADRLLEQTRATLPLTFDELVTWLDSGWSELGRDSLGGDGGGVQVLDVTEARGRTFEHLFVAGLNRGVFPRVVREDPLLPDSLRQVLSREGYGVLPDLARKLVGFSEERFLFAQLLASSPAVTLSWQGVDDDGSPLSVSPLVERMRWSEAAQSLQEWRDPPTVQPLFTLTPKADFNGSRISRPAYEHAVNAAMWGPREDLEGFLSAAMAESTRTPVDWRYIDQVEPLPAVSSPDRLARARLRVLGEMDPARGGGEGELTFGRLGPFFGFVGPILDNQDLRAGRRLYVTALEALAACPWQTFLKRLLRLEALPDPLEILPGISPVLVGDLVHRCLERIVRSQLPTPAIDLEAARSMAPHTVKWPADRELDDLLDRQAELVARRHGIGMRGFSKMLARVTRPYLDQACRLEWAAGVGVPTVAVEIEGRLTLRLEDGEEQDLHFRADRVDIDGGHENLVDYKTGRNDISTAATDATRQKNLIKRIRAGKSLQAIAYAQAAGTPGSRGRYLFLKPDIEGPEAARDIGIDNGNEEAQRAFHKATSTLIDAWRQGSFLPRLIEADRDKAPRRCDFCEVAEACLRHDSGARGRLRTWMAEHLETYVVGPDELASAERSGIGIWVLDSKRLAELDDADRAGDGDS